MTAPRILLLTHEQEIAKKTNTGRLVLDALGPDATQIVWRRASPEPDLLRMIEAGRVALLWPLATRGAAVAALAPHTFVVIDGTWKQARKIYTRSPYLHELPTIALEASAPSIYTLRRNQIGGGLCTAEAVACLLRQPALMLDDGPKLADAIMTRLRTLLAPGGTRARLSSALP